MTAIAYPDCWATSPNKKWLLEARSPHNRTILHRDGTAPSDDEFGFKYGEFQSHFRYRLLYNAGKSFQANATEGAQVIWERWQEKREESPHEVVVSDEGWSIIRTHGFQPSLIVISPAGAQTLKVRIMAPDQASKEPVADTSPAADVDNSPCWEAEHLSHSTAGLYWSGNSWRYFFKCRGTSYFVWRTYWDKRLVIDLDRSCLVPDAESLSEDLHLAMDEEEKITIRDYLVKMSLQAAEVAHLLALRRDDPDFEQQSELKQSLGHAVSALHIVGIHQMVQCLPLLDWWASLDCQSYSTSSVALGRGWSICPQRLRPVLYNSMRLLGQRPPGKPAYLFRRTDGERPVVADLIADRHENTEVVNKGMSAFEVLSTIGAPDHVRKRSHRMENRLYRWTEEWEYDSLVDGKWDTLRLTWAEEGKLSRMTDMETVAAYWLKDDTRCLEYLRW